LDEHFLRQSLKLFASDKIHLEGFLLGFILKFGAAQRFREEFEPGLNI